MINPFAFRFKFCNSTMHFHSALQMVFFFGLKSNQAQMSSTEIKINGKKDVLQHFLKFTSVLYFTWLSQFKDIKTKKNYLSEASV